MGIKQWQKLAFDSHSWDPMLTHSSQGHNSIPSTANTAALHVKSHSTQCPGCFVRGKTSEVGKAAKWREGRAFWNVGGQKVGWNQQMDENLQPPSKWGANSGDGRTKEAASRSQTRAALRHTLPSRMCSIALKELSHTFNSSEQEYSTDIEHQNIRYFFPCFLKVISGSEKNKKRSIIFFKKMCVCVCVLQMLVTLLHPTLVLLGTVRSGTVGYANRRCDLLLKDFFLF